MCAPWSKRCARNSYQGATVQTLLRLITALAAALLVLPLRASEPWPTKPVRIIIPSGPGGTIDPLTRLVADALTKTFGQQFVPENRTGAQGNNGLSAVAKADP